MANKARGEISAMIGDEECVFVANLQSLSEIEDLFDMPFAEVAGLMSSGVRLKTLMHLAIPLAVAGGTDPDVIRKSSDPAKVADAIGRCLSAMVAGEGEPGNGDGAKT